MIKLDLKNKVAMVDSVTPLDVIIMFISAHQTDLNSWMILPMESIEDHQEDDYTLDDENPNTYFN